MDIQVRTFGEVLHRLMESRKISIENLCTNMNLKSKTTVSRILKEKSSINNITNFYNNLIKTNPLKLVAYEKNQLLDAIEVNRIGKENYIANKIMLSFVSKQKHVEELICHKVYVNSNSNSNLDQSSKTLSDLFATYNNFDEVRICILNTIMDSVIQVFSDYLPKYNQIKIEHYIPYEQNKSKNIQQFILTLSLLNFKQYNCYQAYFSQHNRFEFVNRFNNMIVVMKRKNDEYFTDIISIKQDKEFTLLYNNSDKNFFDFYNEIFDDMLTQHNPMKLQSFNEASFDNIIHISKELYDLEKPCSNILIKPDFGVNTISSKMLHRIAYKEKISPENIAIFIKIHDARYNEYCKRSKSYTAIYSKQGILDFLEKGYLCDHLPIIRPFRQFKINN